MKVGIDGNEANIKNRVGVNQYAAELLVHMEKLPEAKKHKFVIYLREKPLSHMPKARDGWEYKVLSGGGLWILRMLMPHLWLSRTAPDIFFSPSHYTPPALPIPSVISIMDLGYLSSREQFKKYDFYQLKHWGALSMRNAKKIIAISESTRSQIIQNYPWAKNKTCVTLLGYDKSRYNPNVSKTKIESVKRKYKINGDYILFLSTLKPSKNIEGLLEGFSLMLHGNLNLVIAGKKGWHYTSIFEKVEQLGLSDKVVFTDFLPEEDKPAIVAGAKIFALTSFWEGFGIPVLEAMACGVPVVVSSVGSLPEVAGPAGIYIDPNNPEDIGAGLDKAYEDQKALSKKVLAQAKKFDWYKTARETIKILEVAAR